VYKSFKKISPQEMGSLTMQSLKSAAEALRDMYVALPPAADEAE